MPSELVSFRVEAPANPELRRIAQDVLQGMQYSFLAAAAQQDAPFPTDSVEEEFRKAILTRPAERRAVYRNRALSVANAPPPAREALFGRYGTLSVKEYGGLGFAGASAKLPPLTIGHDALLAALKGVQAARSKQKALGELDVQKLQALSKPKKPPIKITLPPVKAIRFYITEVRCVDETNPEAFGNDEILMGGLAIDESGNTHKVSPFLVRDDFEDGDVKSYGLPGKEFCGFDATKGKDWPKTYAAVVVLAEEDWGGFAAGLTAAWQKSGPEIKKKVQEVTAGVAEALIGDYLAEWLGKIVAWAMDGLIHWLIDLFADDIFKPGLAIGGLHTPIGLVYNDCPGWQNFASPTGQFTFVGHGGKYTVKCYWRVEV